MKLYFKAIYDQSGGFMKLSLSEKIIKCSLAIRCKCGKNICPAAKHAELARVDLARKT